MNVLSIPHLTQQGNALVNDCGPACVAMLVHALTDQTPTVDDVARRGSPNEFTSLNGIQALLNAHGLAADIVREATLDWYYAQVDAGIAPIGLFAYHVLPAPVRYRWAHFMVVRGYDEQHVYVNDPLQESGPWALSTVAFLRGILTPSLHPKGVNPITCAVRPRRSVMTDRELVIRLAAALQAHTNLLSALGQLL